MKMRNYLMILSFTFGLMAFTSCQDNNRQADNEIELESERDARTAEQERLDRERMDRENNSVSARISDRQELSSFSQGMNRARIDDDLRATEGPYTIFAPSNEAYEELPQEERDQMMDDENRSMATAHYLIVEEEITRDELEREIDNNNGTHTLTTMQGEQLTVTKQDDEIVIRDGSGNTARITDTDEDASNGVVFVIDEVLRPQDANTSQAANRMRDHSQNNMNNDRMNQDQMQNNNMNNNGMNQDRNQGNNMNNDRMNNNNNNTNQNNTTQNNTTRNNR